MSKPIYIRGGRQFDPSTNKNELKDLFIRDGVIAPTPPEIPPEAELVNAHGLVVVPGLIDLHVHLREPGGMDAETIETGSRAAARGGFTTIVAMPNTKPPLDTADRVAQVKKRGEEVGLVQIIPSACITSGRDGRDLADLKALAEAGAGVFTDDGSTVPSDNLMKRAMEIAASLNRTIMDHAQDREIEKGGVMHMGEFSKQWKLPGIPSEAEAKIIRRDIDLAEQTGCAVHIQHVSTKEGVALIREARMRGVNVSGELTPHHLALTDTNVKPDNANFKMNPPLRSKADREALVHGIVHGFLQAFATDHAPHTAEAKARGFRQAPFGIIGLETAVGVTFTELVATGLMDMGTWVRRWTAGPARVLGLPDPSLNAGAPASIAILDLISKWTVRSKNFLSKSRNTPFEGLELIGRAVRTIYRGKTVWME